MCGRFVAASPRDVLRDHFGVDDVHGGELPASYNVAPTDPVHAVIREDGQRVLDQLGWGFVPAGAPDPARASRPINARAETLLERPLFRAHRRCLVPADGFYEWEQTASGRKQPYFIHKADGGPLAFAGVWDEWRDALRTCAIVTTRAAEPVSRLHERMPVVLDPEAWTDWLAGDLDPRDAGALDPAPLALRPVSTRVNDVRNNDSSLVDPVPLEPTLF